MGRTLCCSYHEPSWWLCCRLYSCAEALAVALAAAAWLWMRLRPRLSLWGVELDLLSSAQMLGQTLLLLAAALYCWLLLSVKPWSGYCSCCQPLCCSSFWLFGAARATDSCSVPLLFVSWAIELLVLRTIVLISLPSTKLLLLWIIVQLMPNDSLSRSFLGLLFCLCWHSWACPFADWCDALCFKISLLRRIIVLLSMPSTKLLFLRMIMQLVPKEPLSRSFLGSLYCLCWRGWACPGTDGSAALHFRGSLERNPQTDPTPVTTDNNTAHGLTMGTMQFKASKPNDMYFQWLWAKGSTNRADYPSKHYPARHHQQVQPSYVVDRIPPQ